MLMAVPGLGLAWRMRKFMTWCTGLALAGVLAGCGLSAADQDRPSVSGWWGRVIEVPGPGALNTGKGGGPEVTAVSCASPGNCAAGGYYWHRHSQQGFVAVERNGRWGTAIGVPGLAALNMGGSAASWRCRASRRAAAPLAGTTRDAPQSTGVHGRRGERRVGHGRDVPGGRLNTAVCSC